MRTAAKPATSMDKAEATSCCDPLLERVPKGFCFAGVVLKGGADGWLRALLDRSRIMVVEEVSVPVVEDMPVVPPLLMPRVVLPED